MLDGRLKALIEKRVLNITNSLARFIEDVKDDGQYLAQFEQLDQSLALIREVVADKNQKPEDYMPVRIVLGRDNALKFLENWPTPTFSSGGGTDITSIKGFALGQYDTIQATYPTSSSELYTYKYLGATVGSILVTYTDYEEKDFENKDPLEILENAKNGVGSKGVFIENYPVFYGDYHGIKYVMESTDGPKKYTFFGEIYLIKRHLYQIMFISENGEKNSTEVDDFFNSFEIDLDNEKSKIALLLEEMNFNYAIDSDSDYRLDINFEDGRSQVVYLNYWDNEFESDRQLFIWSPVAKFKSELPDTMMKNLMIYNGNHQSCNFQFISANGDSLMLRIIGFTSLNNNSDLIRKMIIHLSSSADDVEKHYFNSNKW